MDLSIIIPVYNEAATISLVLDQVITNVHDLGEVIIIDDGSTDDTSLICRTYAQDHPLVHYHLQPCNMGKTEALKEGFRRSTGSIVIVQDADLEYNPAEINKVAEPIQSGLADVVLGSRYLQRKTSHSLDIRFYLANRLITFLSNLFTGLNLTDVETCYKAFRGEIIRDMIITSKRFGFEVEVMAKVAKLEFRICEVPISYNGRSYKEGKKIQFVDGIMTILYIFKYNLFPFKESISTRN